MTERQWHTLKLEAKHLTDCLSRFNTLKYNLSQTGEEDRLPEIVRSIRAAVNDLELMIVTEAEKTRRK